MVSALFHLGASFVAHSLYKGHIPFLWVCRRNSKKLNAKPHYAQLKPSRIWLAIGISFAIVLGPSIPFNVSPSDKPGMLVLSMVLVMALTQLLWTAMRRGQSGIAFVGTTGVAGSTPHFTTRDGC